MICSPCPCYTYIYMCSVAAILAFVLFTLLTTAITASTMLHLRIRKPSGEEERGGRRGDQGRDFHPSFLLTRELDSACRTARLFGPMSK